MRLYNTLTRQKDEFKPLKSGQVSLYTCGPTVYDYLHIGNLKAFLTADLLRRVLEANELQVKWVINVTDVDDKTIHRSLEEHPGAEPSAALQTLTRHYEQAFVADTEAVGVQLGAAKLVRATEHIELMQELISKIDAAGFAYAADGSIYFDLAKYTAAGHKYGQLSRVDFKPQARINNDEYGKQEARDFVLWEAADAGEPTWDFEFGGQNLPGRPGWHIECSAMSAKFLGQPFDIHTGGVDLIFPHHENELAQSQAADGKPLANFFIHNEHLLVDGAKMSKSKHNFYTLKDIQAKGGPKSFRLLMLLAHYRTQQNFTWTALADAERFLHKLQAWADLRWQANPESESQAELISSGLQVFMTAVNDDLNTPQALASPAGLIDVLEGGGLNETDMLPFQALLETVDGILGLELLASPDITHEQKSLIQQHQVARAESNYDEADKLRHQLLEEGIELDDTTYGVRWQRTY